ncbi:MAG: 16S rRNA (guanine(966)-N(2))-methyltransferase RsmD [Solirubrobacterales bacterium]|nr:16S rRNA (guanine(966)-N(2))-methyltransferase RsmD [Solirubrobacterales bacterium]
MRVIAGRFGGRRLIAPRGTRTRPTSDRVREALFSVLGETVVDAGVLDLFAGSGALGIEALSRGAAHATFVDSAPAAVRAIRSNLESLGIDAEVQRSDARAALRSARAAARQYDLIFLDPPYRLAAPLADGLSEAIEVLLAPGGSVVCESDRRAPLDLDLALRDQRHYGDTLIRIHGS